MEIILSKQAYKKLSIISISDNKYAILIKKKIFLIRDKNIELYQLKWYKYQIIVYLGYGRQGSYQALP